MRVHLFRAALIVVPGLFVAGCETASPEPGPTATEVSDVPLAAVNATGAETFHFRIRGHFARVAFFAEEPTGVINGFLEVSRGTEEQTLLIYRIERCNPFCEPIEEGNGLIPNGDLVVRGRKVTLRTNTSAEANADFARVIGTGGAITLQWTRVSDIVDFSQIHSRTRFERQFLAHNHVAQTSSSAVARGSIIGYEVSPGTSGGAIGTVREGLISIVKEP